MGIFQYNSKVEDINDKVDNSDVEKSDNDKVETNDSKIEFKGTLSEVFTQALNETYGLESTDSTIGEDIVKDIHVHTYSNEDVNDVHKVISEIEEDVKTYSDVIQLVGLESLDSSKSKLLKSYIENDMKVKVLIGQEAILKGVLDLKKRS